MNSTEPKHSPWRIILIVFLALGMLIGISFLPLSKWTNGKISNINILSDVVEINTPEYEEAIEDVIEDAPLDPCLEEDLAIEIDTSEVDTLSLPTEVDKPLIAVQPSRVGEDVIIEDYTESAQGLMNFRNAINSGSLASVAMVGDSYIEGDIFAQDLRDMLQQAYGGNGVGYVNMYSEFPGFRRSVKQGGGKGWKEYRANAKFDSKHMGITQHYYKLNSTTESTYQGTSSLGHTKSWNKSTFLFSTPTDVQVTLTTSNDTVTFDVTGSPDPQALVLRGNTSVFKVKTSSPSVIGYGVWISDSTGISLDGMSSRGFSGVTLGAVNSDFTSKTRKFVDYKLIILEFGINAMSAKQTNYTGYSEKMVKVIEHLKRCYPNADILVLGIGDRGSKQGSAVHSMAAASHMIEAQRQAARKAHCLFWDTREAMGGDDAIVTWVKNGWANKDYIHLNHKGGKQLAELLYKAIKLNIEK